jgi:hypothetical protein
MATPNEPEGELLINVLGNHLEASLMAAQRSMLSLYAPFNHIVSNSRKFDTDTLLDLEVKIQELTTHIIELSRSLDD